MTSDETYMQICIDLAIKGKFNVSPNPRVGCIVVNDDKIIGAGYHERYAGHHAEVNAINSVFDKSLLETSTLYVNLEPCSHFGKTPPCSDYIIKHKIPKVVIGCVDSFSLVSGKGIQKLKNQGVEVVVGVLEDECRNLNKRFFTFNEKKRPYIILKWAQSEDFYIAHKEQLKPFWMTSNLSKQLVHKWRAEEDAILVGRVTAEKDNPMLTVREYVGNNPLRLVIDKNLKLSKNLNLFSQSDTIIFNNKKNQSIELNKYIKVNFNDLINSILCELYKLKIQSVIIEGGTYTIQSFINSNKWDEARIFTTKFKIINGIRSPILKGKQISLQHIEEDELKIIINK